MTLTRNDDRIRAWLDALPNYRQGRNVLVSAASDGLRHCVLGAGCNEASLAGAPIELQWFDGEPSFVNPHVDTNYGSVFLDLSDWLGVEVLDLAVRPDQLPAALRARVEAAIAVTRAEGRLIAALRTADMTGELSLWLLNDAGVPFPDLADVVRVALGLDLDRVAGTDEHTAHTEQAEADDSSWRLTAGVAA